MYCHGPVGTTELVFIERLNVLCYLFRVSFKRFTVVIKMEITYVTMYLDHMILFYRSQVLWYVCVVAFVLYVLM